MSKKKEKLKLKIQIIGFAIALVFMLFISCFAGLSGMGSSVANSLKDSAENSAKGYTIAINGETEQEITDFFKNNGSKFVSRIVLTAKVDNLLSGFWVVLDKNAIADVTVKVNGYYEDTVTEDTEREDEKPEKEEIVVGPFEVSSSNGVITIERKIVVAQGDTITLDFSTSTTVMLVAVDFNEPKES